MHVMTSKYGVSISWMLCRVCLPAMPVLRRLTETAVCSSRYVSYRSADRGNPFSLLGIVRFRRGRAARPRECETRREKERDAETQKWSTRGGIRLRGRGAARRRGCRTRETRVRFATESAVCLRASEIPPLRECPTWRDTEAGAESEKVDLTPEGTWGIRAPNPRPVAPLFPRDGDIRFILCNCPRVHRRGSASCVACMRACRIASRRAAPRRVACVCAYAVAIFAFALAFRNRYQLHI